MKKKGIILALMAVLAALPLRAVFNEKDLAHTLSVLRFELKQECSKSDLHTKSLQKREAAQHERIIETLKKCNELSLMLYSQSQDYTFDIAYALKEVTKEYDSFNKKRLPFDEITNRMDVEIVRYSRLIESLRRLPPERQDLDEVPDSLAYHNDSLHVFQSLSPELDSIARVGAYAFILDEEGQQDRDSCIMFASRLLKMYQEQKDKIVADNKYYDEANERLKESYDYAHERYEALQKNEFFKSKDNFFKVLFSFPSYCRNAFNDSEVKYSRNISNDESLKESEWRGPIVSGFMVIVLFCLAVATGLGILIFKLLQRYVAYFRSDGFAPRKVCAIFFIGILVFLATVSIVHFSAENHFFLMASERLLTLSLLIGAIFLSMLVRPDPKNINLGLKLYMPVILAGIMVVALRILFLPNRMMNILFPPALLAVFIWQFVENVRNRGKADKIDSIVSYISLLVLAVVTGLSWAGMTMLALIVLIWWLFQLSVVAIVSALNIILDAFKKNTLQHKLDKAKKASKISGAKVSNGDFFNITWLYDLVRMVVIPVASVASIAICINMALSVFDLKEIWHTIFYDPFFDFTTKEGSVIFHLSFYKIVLVVCLYFAFNYGSYAFKAMYRELKIEGFRMKNEREHVLANEINLTLANNVIAIIVWGIYVVVVVLLLKIPMGAVSIIAAGLATGIGLAMKDILNNFIYGIQLMSGRLRVGDWMECDGIRGKVTAISYQSTQIETLDGAVMSFLNTSLFNKNFKNLTRNNSYEFVKIVVGVEYGADIEQVRQVLLDALSVLRVKDKYGRDIVDPKRDPSVAFESFGDSSVNVAVKQYVLVSEKSAYVSKASEVIYNALGEHKISIPFPQRDIHIISE